MEGGAVEASFWRVVAREMLKQSEEKLQKEAGAYKPIGIFYTT